MFPPGFKEDIIACEADTLRCCCCCCLSSSKTWEGMSGGGGGPHQDWRGEGTGGIAFEASTTTQFIHDETTPDSSDTPTYLFDDFIFGPCLALPFVKFAVHLDDKLLVSIDAGIPLPIKRQAIILQDLLQLPDHQKVHKGFQKLQKATATLRHPDTGLPAKILSRTTLSPVTIKRPSYLVIFEELVIVGLWPLPIINCLEVIPASATLLQLDRRRQRGPMLGHQLQ